MGLAAAADHQALFEKLSLRHIDCLRRQAMRLTGNREDAQDLVQDTLLRAYIGFRRFQPHITVQAWVLRIVINAHINSVRPSRRRPLSIP